MSIYGKQYNLDEEKEFIGADGPDEFYARPANDDTDTPYPYFRLNQEDALVEPEPLICKDALEHLKVESWDDVIMVAGVPTNCECTNWQSWMKSCFIPANEITSCSGVKAFFAFFCVPEDEPCIVEDDAVCAVYMAKTTYKKILDLVNINKLLGDNSNSDTLE
jgi:hypothetical protein